MSEPEHQGSVAHCPGAPMSFTFSGLTPGTEYTITLDGGLSFTGASSGTDALPGGVTVARTQATFTTPSGDAVAGGVDVSFTLGAAVEAGEVSGSTNLNALGTLTVGLLGGSATAEGGPFQVGGWGDPPPTCVLLDQRLFNCPVCAGDASKCPEAVARGSQFYLDMHRFVCCQECPDECEAVGS